VNLSDRIKSLSYGIAFMITMERQQQQPNLLRPKIDKNSKIEGKAIPVTGRGCP
jgi:hypothetical protein